MCGVKKEVSIFPSEYQNQMIEKCNIILKRVKRLDIILLNQSILIGTIIWIADKKIAKGFNKREIITKKMISDAVKCQEFLIEKCAIELIKEIDIKKEALEKQ